MCTAATAKAYMYMYMYMYVHVMNIRISSGDHYYNVTYKLLFRW